MGIALPTVRVWIRRWERWGPAPRDLLTAGFVLLVGWFCLRALTNPASFIDASAYYAAPLAYPYGVSTLGVHGAYLYSPAFLQAITPLRLLPPGIFVALFVCAEAAALIALTGRRAGAVALVGFFIVRSELNVANINLLLTVAMVAGFRWPALWSAVLLTKVTPGVGLLWFALRREWGALAVALGATVAIAALSWAAAPALWKQWIGVLVSNGGQPGILPLRLCLAVALMLWAAPRGQRWAVPVAATLGMPDMFGLAALAMLVGVVPLARSRHVPQVRRSAGGDEANPEAPAHDPNHHP